MQVTKIAEQLCYINYYQLINNLRKYYLVASSVNYNANDGKKMFDKCMIKYICLIWIEALKGYDRGGITCG